MISEMESCCWLLREQHVFVWKSVDFVEVAMISDVDSPLSDLLTL